MRDGSTRHYVTIQIPLGDLDILLANQIAAAKKLLGAGEYARTARIVDGALEMTWTQTERTSK